MMRLICSTVLLLASSASIGASDECQYRDFFEQSATHLVPDFRLPTEEDFGFYWSQKDAFPYKTKDGFGANKAPYWTCGYFNGDDAVDYAYILFSKQTEEKYLFAFLSANGHYSAMELMGAHNREMGLATQESGKVTTASGKGYWAPSPEDPPEIEIHSQAIAFFLFESAASLFVWNSEEGAFKRHWISD